MSISDWGIQAIPVITVIVFLIAEAVKATPLDNKWLPVICGATGGQHLEGSHPDDVCPDLDTPVEPPSYEEIRDEFKN